MNGTHYTKDPPPPTPPLSTSWAWKLNVKTRHIWGRFALFLSHTGNVLEAESCSFEKNPKVKSLLLGVRMRHFILKVEKIHTFILLEDLKFVQSFFYYSVVAWASFVSLFSFGVLVRMTLVHSGICSALQTKPQPRLIISRLLLWIGGLTLLKVISFLWHYASLAWRLFTRVSVHSLTGKYNGLGIF